MNAAFEVSVNDNATQRIRDAVDLVGAAKAADAAGAGAANVVRRHFIQLNRERHNPIGGASSNYYGDAAAKTFSSGVPGLATVTVAQTGIRLHYEGGTVTAAPGKALALPVNPAAYGHSPLEFANLKLIVFKKQGGAPGAAVLAAQGGTAVGVGDHTRLKKGARIGQATNLAQLTTMYLLVDHTDHVADPTVLPTDAEIQAGATRGLANWANDVFARKAAA